jgi:cytochrome b
MSTDPRTSGHSIRIWDLPVRVTHWSFAALIPAMWWTAENHEMEWHMRLGIALLALLVFRIAWGFVGSSTARFNGFIRGPRAVAQYLGSLRRVEGVPVIGHNAAGGWSVLALLGFMSVQVGLGLFAGDPDDGTTGPLNNLVSYATTDRITDLHEWLFNLLVGFILLHLAAIVFYRLVKKEDIVRPMVTGRRRFSAPLEGMQGSSALRALLCAAGSVLVAWWIWNGASFA